MSAELGWSPECMRGNTRKESGEDRMGAFYFILKALEKDLGILSG